MYLTNCLLNPTVFQADMCLLVLQSGWVQRVQHPVCCKSRAGESCGTGEGCGADPGVRAAAHPTAQLPPGGPQPLQTHGRPAHRPQGGWTSAVRWWVSFLMFHFVPFLIFFRRFTLRPDCLRWRIQSRWGRLLMTSWHRHPWQMQGCCFLPLRLPWQPFSTVPQEPVSVWRGNTFHISDPF